jgi:hypothetical protein
MNKLKTFSRTFVKSLTSPSYYKDILKAKPSFSFKYLIFLLLIINLVLGVRFAVSAFNLLPQIDPFLKEAKVVITDLYPEKLIVTIRKAKITTNVKEPYFIGFPEKVGTFGSYKYLLTIDTKGKVDDYVKDASLFLLTSENLVVPDENETYKVIPLSEELARVPDGTKFARAQWDEMIKLIDPYLAKVSGIAEAGLIVLSILLPFVMTASSLVWKLVYLLVWALPLWLLAKILKKKLSYGETYRLSMHGLTLPLLIGFGLTLLGLYLPFVYTIAFVVWMVIVLVKIKA